MPHIRMRGLSAEHVQKINTSLVKELSQTTGSAEDHFTFELVKTDFFVNGKAVSGTPFVEVLWFSRDQKTQDACANIITEKVKALVGDQDVTVIFVELTKTSYYENGNHF